MPSVSFENVRKKFGDVVVVEDFSLRVEDGELLVLVGGSGSGKSTILRMAAGLESVTSGTIRIDDRDITNVAPRDRDVAMVFQDYALYPHLSVRDNLSLGLRLRRMPATEINRRVLWAAGMLGLEALLDRKPKQLSGGQRQRVAMGRAMVREPLVFLFDEPLSNLDASLRARMRIEIGGLQRRLNTTTIYVTHDQVEAMTLGDRIVVLANGIIQQIGRPIELYRNPINRFVAGFIGTPPMNFVEGNLQPEDGKAFFAAEGMRIELDRLPLSMPSKTMTLGIRPEDLTIAGNGLPSASSARSRLSGKVLLVERLGGTSHIHMDVGPHRLLAIVSSDEPPDVGDIVGLDMSSDRVHLFGDDGNTVARPA